MCVFTFFRSSAIFLSLGLFFSSFSLYKEVSQPSPKAERNNNAHHEGEDVFATLFQWEKKNAEKKDSD